MELLAKAVISGAIVAIASEVARRSSLLAALLLSLPLTSILAMVWLWLDDHDPDEIAALSWSILWVVIPSLLFFLALPVLLRLGVAFWPALAGAGVITATGYVVWLAAARGLGVGG